MNAQNAEQHPPYILSLADPRATLPTVGGKGASLARMASASLPVPGGFHVTTAAYRHFVEINGLQAAIERALEAADPARPATLDRASEAIRARFSAAPMPEAIAEAIRHAYRTLAAETPETALAVAVRSSATAEDLPGASFAGQQETYLNVRGEEAVLAAVQDCWGSLWTARAIGYRERQHVGLDGLSLAVVVQRLVPADAAGIMFTANPTNGQREQALINAAWGLGEAVVGGEVTPDTFVVDKPTGEIVERTIAEKREMTARVEGGTAAQPVPEPMRTRPALDDDALAALVRLGARIEELYDAPMDIEWTLCAGELAIVQARPITALPEPSAPPPTEWPLPDPKGKYARASVVELLPDPLTPLFDTLGRAAINAATQRLMAEMGGVREGWPDETVVTINDYAYYSTSFPTKALLKLIVTVPFTMPRMIREAESHWRDEVHPRYVETIERWQARPLAELPAADLLVGARQIADAAFDVYTTYQSALFPKANISEMLFTAVYERLIRREGDPEALTFLVGLESTPIRGEKALYDIAAWCREHPALAAYVQETPPSALAAHLEGDAPPEIEGEVWRGWQARWRAHRGDFGHIIYNLDFAKALPADDPTPMLSTCKMYLEGACRSPYERQQAAVERREQAKRAIQARLKGLRRRWFDKLTAWAERSVPLREEGLSDLGLGYPHLRRMLLELGRRLAEAGAIEEADDVFWLEQAEAERAARALDAGQNPGAMEDTVRERQAVWRGERRATPPPVLPPKSRWMGISLEAFAPAKEGEQTENLLKGEGTSPGRITATARVLHGPEDFEQLQPGDVLVAAITTPAWTPLFARAAAVVTDVGGQLSHGSIVAREYGIPAVMGTGTATQRIQSGQSVTVDGDTGEVKLAA